MKKGARGKRRGASELRLPLASRPSPLSFDLCLSVFICGSHIRVPRELDVRQLHVIQSAIEAVQQILRIDDIRIDVEPASKRDDARLQKLNDLTAGQHVATELWIGCEAF